MYYLIVSYTHKNSDIEMREKLAFDVPEKNEKFLKLLLENKFIDEAVIFSTCNRVEVFLFVRDMDKTLVYFFEHLGAFFSISPEELRLKADVYQEEGAIHHLFCVCSSLDSLVVGETQIAGQIKSAFKFAYDKGYCKQGISRAIHFAFRCAASVRNATEISKNPVSVASVAVMKAREVLETLQHEKVVVIGLGEMSRLSIKHLLNFGAEIVLLNRHIESAKEFACEQAKYGKIEVVGFGEIVRVIHQYRILFSATGAPHAIITPDMIKEVDFERFWFDLAVPRDIHLGDYAHQIRLFGVDDLQDIVAKNLSLREEQANNAYRIIGTFTQQFFVWLQSLSVEPVIKALREQAKRASEEEIAKAIKKGYLPKEYEHNIHKAVHNIFNRFLHYPTLKLKGVAEEPQADIVVESLKLLFGIDNSPSILDQYRCEYDTTTQSIT